MKKHHKVGNKKGSPAYRTPSGFKVQKAHQRKQKQSALSKIRHGFAFTSVSELFGTKWLETINLPKETLIDIIINLTNVLLGTLAIIFLLLVLYGGFTWMVSAGDDDRAAKGRKIIGHAVVGILVIFLSVPLAQMVFNFLGEAAL